MADPIKPTAADRIAASNYLRAHYFDEKSEKFHSEMLSGQRDISITVQAFALHAQQAREQALEDHDDELAGQIAYEISKTYMMDVPTARAAIDRAMQEKRALEAYFTQAIQDAAGDSVITRQPITGPDWPNRSDYPNRKQWLAACAKWRRNQ